MSNAFHDSIPTLPKTRAPEQPPIAGAVTRVPTRARVHSRAPLRDTLSAALKKQLSLLEEDLRAALDGDPDSVRAVRAATRRIGVALSAMQRTGVVERTGKLRRRVARIRRAFDGAARYDLLADPVPHKGADSPRAVEGLRARVYARLCKRIDRKQTRKTLAALGRLAVGSTRGGDGLGVREAARLLARRGCEKVGPCNDADHPKRRELKRLERSAGRLLYTLELFAGVLTGAGDRLRSQLAEAQGDLVALRDAERAFDQQPSMGRRRRRDSLRARIGSKISFLTGAQLRGDMEAAIGQPTSAEGDVTRT